MLSLGQNVDDFADVPTFQQGRVEPKQTRGGFAGLQVRNTTIDTWQMGRRRLLVTWRAIEQVLTGKLLNADTCSGLLARCKQR
jgi:hypothetical protein